MASIEFDRDFSWNNAGGDLAAALKREWLETNGLGGFASSTVAGANTRRYHGLLVGDGTARCQTSSSVKDGRDARR